MLLSATTVDVLGTIMTALSSVVMFWLTVRQLMIPQPRRQRILIGVFLFLFTLAMIFVFVAIWEPRVLRRLYGADW